MRLKTWAMVLVRRAIWRRSPSVSELSLYQRSAQRAWVSLSEHPWQGWLRILVRRVSSCSCSPLGRSVMVRCLVSRGGLWSMRAWRMREAVSRRSLGVLRVSRLGSLMRETGSIIPSKSRGVAVRVWASSVSIPMRGSVLDSARVVTTAYPRRRPVGMWMMSPGSSSWILWCAWVRAWRWFVFSAFFSRALMSRRNAKYSAKSPRWQRMDSWYPARAFSFLRTRAATPTTDLSAWNWAKEDSRIFRVRSAP